MTEVTFRKVPSTTKNAEKSKPGAPVYDDQEVCDIKLTEFTTGSYLASDITDDGNTYAQKYGVQYAAFKDGVAPEHQNDPTAAREAADANKPKTGLGGMFDKKPEPEPVVAPAAPEPGPFLTSPVPPAAPAPKAEPVA